MEKNNSKDSIFEDYQLIIQKISSHIRIQPLNPLEFFQEFRDYATDSDILKCLGNDSEESQYMKLAFPKLSTKNQLTLVEYRQISKEFRCYKIGVMDSLNSCYKSRRFELPKEPIIRSGVLYLTADQMKNSIIGFSICQIEDLFDLAQKNIREVQERLEISPSVFEIGYEVDQKTKISVDPNLMPLCVRGAHLDIMNNKFTGESTMDKHTYPWANLINQLGQKEKWIKFVEGFHSDSIRAKEIISKLKFAHYNNSCKKVSENKGCMFEKNSAPEIEECLKELCSQNSVPYSNGINVDQPFSPFRIMKGMNEWVKENTRKKDFLLGKKEEKKKEEDDTDWLNEVFSDSAKIERIIVKEEKEEDPMILCSIEPIKLEEKKESPVRMSLFQKHLSERKRETMEIQYE